MAFAAHEEQAERLPQYSLYIVTHQGINERIRALARMQSSRVHVTFIAGRDTTVESAEFVRIQPWPNPLGLLRHLGLHELKRRIDSLIYFPSRERLYALPAGAYLNRRIQSDLDAGRKVVVLTTLPAHTVALVGLALKSTYPDIRWVIDWRDLWTFDETYFTRVHPWHRSRVRTLEKQLVTSCDLNVTTNDEAAAVLAGHYPAARDKTRAITHHFNPHETVRASRSVVEIRSDAPIRLVFMGGMFKGSKVPGMRFLEALRAIRERVIGPSVELHLYGKQSHEFDAIRDHVDQYGLTCHDFVAQPRVVGELRRYDMLVLLLGDSANSRVVMHQKLPAYLASGKPILAIVPKGSAVARTLTETGTGWVVESDSDWPDGIQGVAAELRAGRVPTRNEGIIEQFSWTHVGAQWRAALSLPSEF